MNRGRKRRSKGVRFRGESLEAERIKEIRRLIRSQRGATQSEIAKQVCLQWDWRQPKGGLSVRSCLDLLRRLEDGGLIRLPPPRTRPGRRKRVTIDEVRQGRDESAVEKGDICLRAVTVRPVRREEVQRWRELMARFHYLGDGELVGESLRYVAEAECGWLAGEIPRDVLPGSELDVPR